MSNTMQINIVSAEQEIFSGVAEMFFAPSADGDIGVYAGHTPLLSMLRPGEVRVKLVDGDDEAFYISGGLLEVQPDAVTVLSDTAVRAHDLDEAAAIEARERAEKLMQGRESDIDYASAQAEFAEALAQLATIQRLRKRGGR
jgi:F-type H+-transporting ATPase subunit epsilon